MKEWYSIADLVALKHHSLPNNKRQMLALAKDHRWDEDRNRSRDVEGNGGVRKEYHYTLLPPLVQGKIVTDAMIDEVAQIKEVTRDELRSQSLWHVFHTAPGTSRAEAEKRLKLLQQIDALMEGQSKVVATEMVSNSSGVPARTLYRYREMVAGIHKTDWLAALVPAYVGRVVKADCHPRIWDTIVGDYLRPSDPTFASCYARTKETAAANNWTPLPASSTLKRRIETEFGPVAITLARKGKAAAAQLYPAQTRDVTVFHAMEATNADGHVFDIFVLWEDGSIGRPCLIGFQDIFSGMVLSHRISRTENKETTRLAIADMVESWGIPDHVYFDNGRAFMSKWITGGMEHRFRFKVKDEEPRGVLTQLNVKVHNTTPYHGQAKPIERAWRDMVDRISRHPAMDGAFTGNHVDAKPENYRARAIPIEDFRKFVAGEIMRHNTRTDRNTKTAKGRSFADVFQDSMEAPGVIIRKATALQRQFFLMAGEGKTARKGNGEIHLADNRYWSENLIAHAGRKLMIRFDPENLHDDLFVYTMDGRFIDRAVCIEAEGFNDAEAARRHASLKRQFMRANREVLKLGRLLTPAQVAAQIPDPEPYQMELPKVVGLHIEPGQRTTASPDAADAFSRGLTASLGISSIFDRPNKKNVDG